MSVIKFNNQVVDSEFNIYRNIPGLLAIFTKAPIMTHPKYCKNCDGLGTTPFFFATAGPFDYQPPTTKDVECTTHPETKKWYQGKYAEFPCPVCNTSGIDPEWRQPAYSVRPMVANIFKATGEVEVLEELDYTDV